MFPVSHVLRLDVGLIAIALAVGVQQANANVGCNFENSLTTCTPGTVSEYVGDRMKQSRTLFENSLCKVSEIVFSGDAESTKPSAYEAEIYVRYACENSRDGASKSGVARYKTGEIISARYSFLCVLRQFKYSARGSDVFSDGTRSHWDTLTSKVPWQILVVGNGDRHLESLFHTWCE